MVLFDIDGTLIDVFPLHIAVYKEVFRNGAGIQIRRDEHLAREFGKPEHELLGAVLATYGIRSPPKSLLRRLEQAYIRGILQATRHITPACVLPGVIELLNAWKKLGKTLVAISGNPKSTGNLLLSGSGLAPFFDATAFSNETLDGKKVTNRADIVRLGISRANKKAGARFSAGQVLVVGDSPSDIHAAHSCGVDALAVATGRYSVSELNRHRPAFCLKNLARTKRKMVVTKKLSFKKQAPKKIRVVKRKK